MAAANRKISNEYAQAVGELYPAVPKAVFAALAVSALTNGGDWLDNAEALVVEEWWILHEAGIVPQKPSRPRPLIDEAR